MRRLVARHLDSQPPIRIYSTADKLRVELDDKNIVYEEIVLENRTRITVAECLPLEALGIAKHGNSTARAKKLLKQTLETKLNSLAELGSLEQFLDKQGFTIEECPSGTFLKTVELG